MNSTTTAIIPDTIVYIFEGELRIEGVDADGITALIVEHESDYAGDIRRALGAGWTAVEYDPDMGYKWQRKVAPDARAAYDEAYRLLRSNRLIGIADSDRAARRSFEMMMHAKRMGERVAGNGLYARLDAYKRMQGDEQLRYFYKLGLI